MAVILLTGSFLWPTGSTGAYQEPVGSGGVDGPLE